MKSFFTALFLLTSLSAMAAREQCIVDKKDSKKTAVTMIIMPEKGGKIVLTGFNLACDNAADEWCTFKVGVNKQETIYTISDRTYLTLEKKTGPKRKGTFTSDFYAKGKVSVTCIVPVLVRHH